VGNTAEDREITQYDKAICGVLGTLRRSVPKEKLGWSRDVVTGS
jgi:hypothetical protein